MKLNPYFLGASQVAALTAAIHTFVGGVTIASPLLSSTLVAVPKLTLYAVWHMVSLTLGLSAAAFFVCGLPRHENASFYMGLFLSVLWILFGIVFLVVAFTQYEAGWWLRLPQWTLLIPTGILGLLGSNKSLKRTLSANFTASAA